jgi:hypothetical protein
MEGSIAYIVRYTYLVVTLKYYFFYIQSQSNLTHTLYFFKYLLNHSPLQSEKIKHEKIWHVYRVPIA